MIPVELVEVCAPDALAPDNALLGKPAERVPHSRIRGVRESARDPATGQSNVAAREHAENVPVERGAYQSEWFLQVHSHEFSAISSLYALFLAQCADTCTHVLVDAVSGDRPHRIVELEEQLESLDALLLLSERAASDSGTRHALANVASDVHA